MPPVKKVVLLLLILKLLFIVSNKKIGTELLKLFYPITQLPCLVVYYALFLNFVPDPVICLILKTVLLKLIIYKIEL